MDVIADNMHRSNVIRCARGEFMSEKYKAKCLESTISKVQGMTSRDDDVNSKNIGKLYGEIAVKFYNESKRIFQHHEGDREGAIIAYKEFSKGLDEKINSRKYSNVSEDTKLFKQTVVDIMRDNASRGQRPTEEWEERVLSSAMSEGYSVSLDWMNKAWNCMSQQYYDNLINNKLSSAVSKGMSLGQSGAAWIRKTVREANSRGYNISIDDVKETWNSMVRQHYNELIKKTMERPAFEKRAISGMEKGNIKRAMDEAKARGCNISMGDVNSEWRALVSKYTVANREVVGAN